MMPIKDDESQESGRLYREVLQSPRLSGPGQVLKQFGADWAEDPALRQHLRLVSSSLVGFQHRFAESVVAASAAEAKDCYLVCERVSGEPLSAILSREGTLELRPWRVLANMLIEVLQAAHAAKIVHGNLSPSRILVTRDPQSGEILSIKVRDFGLGRPLRPGLWGVIGYLAPEQVDTRYLRLEPTPRSDQFALGVILLEALSGQRPFAGASLEESAGKLVGKDPPHFGIPGPSAQEKRIVNALHKALARLPQSRFESLHELAGELEEDTSAQGDTGQAPSTAVAAFNWTMEHEAIRMSQMLLATELGTVPEPGVPQDRAAPEISAGPPPAPSLPPPSSPSAAAPSRPSAPLLPEPPRSQISPVVMNAAPAGSPPASWISPARVLLLAGALSGFIVISAGLLTTCRSPSPVPVPRDMATRVHREPPDLLPQPRPEDLARPLPPPDMTQKRQPDLAEQPGPKEPEEKKDPPPQPPTVVMRVQGCKVVGSQAEKPTKIPAYTALHECEKALRTENEIARLKIAFSLDEQRGQLMLLPERSKGPQAYLRCVGAALGRIRASAGDRVSRGIFQCTVKRQTGGGKHNEAK